MITIAKTRRLVAKTKKANVGSLILIALVFGSCVANAQSSDGESDAKSGTVFDITKFGGVGDGATNNFKAFRNAWIQACSSSTPATILIPKGQFLAGPVIFAGPCQSPVTVEVIGTVIATTTGYATPEWILFERVDNILLTGTGTFHGRGEQVWKKEGCGKKFNCNLPPTSLKFRNMKNVEIKGITSVNSKAFHMFLVKAENFKIHKIKLIAPAESPNTDGIHLSNADHIHIYDSTFATGDDCVSVGRGCNNVTVDNVLCGPGHGLSIGSLGKYKKEEDVTDIFVRNSKMVDTDNGLRIKTWGGSDPSKAQNIVFENIVMERVKNPIIIDQNYGSRGGDSRVAVGNIMFRNIKGTTISRDAVQFMCSRSVPCKGVGVDNVNLEFVGKPGTKSKSKTEKKTKTKTDSTGSSVGSICENVKVAFEGPISFAKC